MSVQSGPLDVAVGRSWPVSVAGLTSVGVLEALQDLRPDPGVYGQALPALVDNSARSVSAPAGARRPDLRTARRLLPELFATRYRYTGAGMTYNLGGVAGGAVVLVVAAPLAASAWGAQAIGVYMAVMLLISIACLLALPETRGRSLTEAR